MFGILTALFHGVYMTESLDGPYNQTDMVQRVRNDLIKELHLDNFTAECSNGTQYIE